jgi:hypothetical protein
MHNDTDRKQKQWGVSRSDRDDLGGCPIHRPLAGRGVVRCRTEHGLKLSVLATVERNEDDQLRVLGLGKLIRQDRAARVLACPRSE